MALRLAPTLLGTYIRAGVLSVAPNAVTCVAHGLPAVPDTITSTYVSLGTGIQSNGGVYLQSWDKTAVYFANSGATLAQGLYVRIAQEHSIIS